MPIELLARVLEALVRAGEASLAREVLPHADAALAALQAPKTVSIGSGGAHRP